MTQTALRDKVLNIQAELEVVKKALQKEPDFSIDEANWQKIKPEAKKTRKLLYRKFYGKR